jgi:hypothetical protein
MAEAFDLRIRIAFGGFNAVAAAAFCHRLRLAKDGVNIAKIFARAGRKTSLECDTAPADRRLG